MARLGLSDSMRSSLGLSDSMRSSTNVEKMETFQDSEQHCVTCRKSTIGQQSKVMSSVLRILVGCAVVVILLFSGVTIIIQPWKRIPSPLERLEQRIALLGADTARVQTTAEKFLQSYLEAQVAASTRTMMLHNARQKNYNEQASTWFGEHELVMRNVLQYYAQQTRTILQTRDRLSKMNITLPLNIAMKPVPNKWQGDEAKTQSNARLKRFPEAIEGLLFSENATLQLSMENIALKRQTKDDESPSIASAFFYVFVVYVFAVYVWNGLSGTRTELMLKDKWSCSPVSSFLSRLKTWLGKVVTIEDLRTRRTKKARWSERGIST